MAPIFVGSNSDDSRIRSDRVGLAASTSNPASAVTGDVYYNSTDNKLTVYNGSDWAAGGGGGTAEFIASGTLSNGATVIINTDGTVSAVTETITNALNPGSSVVFESAEVGTKGGAAYDSANQKVVITYRDDANSDKGTAVVGTVSGNSISFGTPVVFETGYTSESRVVYDSTNEKVVIAFMDNGNSTYGKAVVGTVSGTSISFGSITTFESATLSNLEMAYDSSNERVVIIWRKNDGVDYYGWSIVGTVSGTSISFGTKVAFYNAFINYYDIAYDSSNQKVVIVYQAGGNSDYGTAIVGTVSGTSISYGTSVVFESASSIWNAIVYDSSNQKVVIAYNDSGNSGHGTAIVGTVSGTSISFGTAVVFNSATTTYIKSVYDSTNNKVVFAYRDSGNSNHGTAIVGTVSGTSISFGSAVVYQAYDNYNIGLAYDSGNDKIVIAYRDSNNSNYGTVKVGDAVQISRNLTSTNFIGFSDAAYSDGDTANIQIEGSVDDAQSGLTTARKHYVQNDGTLSTTAGDPSVGAGIAISGTEIIIETSSLSSTVETPLYDFTSAYFTVSQSLSNSSSSDAHRTGPTQTEVRAWLSGSSNGGGSHSWANTYVDCPTQGYQRWTIPKSGKYKITAKGGNSGQTDSPDDYMRGCTVVADFNLTQGEKLIMVAGQGVPDFDGDHCNGGAGASWVMSGDTIATCVPLVVATGAGGDTSDGGAKAQPNTTLGSSITVTPSGGEGGGSAVTGKQTTPVLGSGATNGRGSQKSDKPNSGGWLSDGADAGESGVGGHGFRTDLIGGTRSNSTAGYGGFGGGSGGEDESGSAGGGFTGAHGEDGSTSTGHGSSFVNDDNVGNVSVSLNTSTTTYQNSDYTSTTQYQGWVKVEFVE